MLRWVAKGILLALLAGATVAVVVRLHRPAGTEESPPVTPEPGPNLPAQSSPAPPTSPAPRTAPSPDLGDIQAMAHDLVDATHPALRGALLARLDPRRLQAVSQFLAGNPPAFDGPRTRVAMFDVERYGDWLTARADVEAHLRGGEMLEQLAAYLLDPSLDPRAVTTLATLPDAVEVAEVLLARGQRGALLHRLASIEAGGRGDQETVDVVEQARLVLTLGEEEGK